MAKKSHASFPPERLIRRTSADIRNKPLSKKDEAALRKIAERQAAGDDSHIDYSDIPPLTDEQLTSMVRLRDLRERKIPVSLRLDPNVIVWLKSKGSGYLTRINDILLNVMEAEKRVEASKRR
jgi:uncharacterized protein (DUF4415 family)